MSRLLSPDDKCIGVDVGPTRYNGLSITPRNSEHAALLKQAGYTESSVAGPPAKKNSRTCTACGFKTYFITCGRCGDDCV